MPSFDIVSQVDQQELDNAVNNVRKEVETRYDFRNVTTVIDLNKKDKKISVLTGDEMKIKALKEMLAANCAKRKVDPQFLEWGKVEPTSKGQVKAEVKIVEGISKDMAKKIVKLIKDKGLKVQPSIQDEQVRVTGKKIDDLQEVIQMLKTTDLDLPLQYVNMKS
ncbi:MAG: YajQ family cyclic di-GMP-binding protein [Desulfocurvibacter africanus]